MLNKYLEKYKKTPVQIRASFWFLICSFLQKGISVITTPIFTRILSTAEYGSYSVFNSWMSICSVFITLNLFSGVFAQGMVKYEDKKKQYASALQGLCFTLCLGWTIVYLIFRNFFNNLFTLTTVQMVAMLVLIWTSAVFSFWSSSERIDFKYRKLVIVSLIMSIATPAIGIVFVLNANDKVTARILGTALVSLIGYGWMFIHHMKEGKTFYDSFFWKHALSFNIPLIPHYLSMTVLNSSDRIMIKDMVGSSEAGIYNLAYSVSSIMNIFNTALMQTIEPWLYKKIKAQRIEDISKVAYPSFILIAVVNILLIALAPEIVSIFAPSSYYDAIWIIPSVAMSVFFQFLYTFFAVFEFYYEKTKFITLATSGGAILNIILNYIFIKLYGYYAAGYTTLFCYMCFALYHYYFMKKICNTYLNGASPYNTKILVTITVIFLALGFGLQITYNNWILRYGLLLVIFIGLFIKRKDLIDMAKNIMNLKKEK